MEFSLVATLLFTLIFGVIIFGVLFGYRQQLTQAAAEGARAAVPVAYTPSSFTAVQEAARLQVNRSLSGSKRSCPSGGGSLAVDGISCSFAVYACAGTTTTPPTGADDCLQVTIVLDNDRKPLIAKMPFISYATPASLTGTYVVRLAGYAPS